MSEAGEKQRARILAADDLGKLEVEVPEWGETLTVRGMTAGEVERFGRIVNETPDAPIMAEVVVAVVINGDGGRVFQDSDAALLAEKSPRALQRLFTAAQKVSGLEDDHEGN